MRRNLRKGWKNRLPHDEYVTLLTTIVFPRDGWRCRVPWCRRRDNLHGHHIIFRSHGGKDEAENLLTLCYFCHEDFHLKKKFTIEGIREDEVKFVRWAQGNIREVYEPETVPA